MHPINERLATLEALMGTQDEKLDKIYDGVQKVCDRIGDHDVWISAHKIEAMANANALAGLQKTVAGHQSIVQKAKGAWLVLAFCSVLLASLFEITQRLFGMLQSGKTP